MERIPDATLDVLNVMLKACIPEGTADTLIAQAKLANHIASQGCDRHKEPGCRVVEEKYRREAAEQRIAWDIRFKPCWPCWLLEP